MPRPLSVNPRRIVLVEDNDDVRELLGRLLVLVGHDVATAADGATGIELLLGAGPIVGLIDLGLPKMDGFEVARQVRRRQRAPVPILIAITGHVVLHTEVLAAGFDDHITKPATLDGLHQVFRRHLVLDEQ
jgi:CheY-like chemotaxis protein